MRRLRRRGDLCNDGSARDIQATVDWLRSLPHPYKVAIGGNHDSLAIRGCGYQRCRLLGLVECPVEGVEEVRADGVTFNRRPIPDYFIASPLVALLYPVHQILLRLRGPPRISRAEPSLQRSPAWMRRSPSGTSGHSRVWVSEMIPDYFIASPLVALLYPVHQILLRLRGPPRLPPPGLGYRVQNRRCRGRPRG
jgi:hypothetical protein